VATQSTKIKLRLSPQAERYARRDAPVEARRMAARGALPLEPTDLATVLFALMHDADAEVKERARASLEALPRPVLESVVAAPAHPALLAFLAHLHAEDEAICQALALNPATDDRSIALLAACPFRSVVDIVSQNQERMMRCDAIVEALGSNPLTGRAVIERIMAFLGMSLDAPEDEGGELDEAASEAAVLELLGDEMAEFATALSRESDDVVDDEITEGNLFAAVQNMTVMQKIKLARMGGTEARGLLIRDRNKVVATAAISSPRVTESEVVGFAQSRGVCDEVLRMIAQNREWTRSYQVKLALSTNPKVPQSTSMQFLNYLQDRDLKAIMKSRDVPSAVSSHARRLLQKKGKI